MTNATLEMVLKEGYYEWLFDTEIIEMILNLIVNDIFKT